MNNSRESEEIYQIYQEGIFDRVGARIKGIGNTKFFGGTGYNAGKAESFKGKFYARIIKDIDKFLKEVQTMGNIRSLADFEQKYPDMARKIACMADAVGHTTQLTVQCVGTTSNPTTSPPVPTTPPPVPTTAPPVPVPTTPPPIPTTPKPKKPTPKPKKPTIRKKQQAVVKNTITIIINNGGNVTSNNAETIKSEVAQTLKNNGMPVSTQNINTAISAASKAITSP